MLEILLLKSCCTFPFARSPRICDGVGPAWRCMIQSRGTGPYDLSLAQMLDEHKGKPTQWAAACSRGRVREPWEPTRTVRKPAQRATACSESASRGEDNWPRPSAVARCAGLRALSRCVPRARGLALGYMLSPAEIVKRTTALIFFASLMFLPPQRG